MSFPALLRQFEPMAITPELRAIIELLSSLPVALDSAHPAGNHNDWKLCAGQEVGGNVYQHPEDSSKAIKVIQIHNNSRVESAVKEARKMYKLKDHENIIRLRNYFYSFQIVNGQLIGEFGIVMDFASEGSLLTVINRVKENTFVLTYKQDLKWLLEIASALEFMHGKQEIHLDLKPENILVMADRSIRLCNLGLTHNYGNSTAFQSVRGTHNYIAAEIIKGEGPVYASDMFSYSMTAFYILSRKGPPGFIACRNVDKKVERVNEWLANCTFSNELSFLELKTKLEKNLSDKPNERLTSKQMWDFLELLLHESQLSSAIN